ncbi:MAG: helix-turn-helix domain-containing protein [Desulfobulbus sp.]|nr:helix-turn-helix domain-containing protein [Desulfobulbus sp.]
MGDSDYMVTQKEAADFLKVSTKSISRYRKRGLPYKLVLNPVTGKQEVRFRYADLERWDEGRQLLATYARDGEEAAVDEGRSGGGLPAGMGAGDTFLEDLLLAYKQQIELLREQLEDMRGQLARRDRQIDDLMRLMVGLQLEYKPVAVAQETFQGNDRETGPRSEERMASLYEAVVLPVAEPATPVLEAVPAAAEPSGPEPAKVKKTFSWEQLAASIQRLRQKGKSYEEIAWGLNQINVATISGHPEWTVLEVQALLPTLVDSFPRTMADGEVF